MKGFVDSHTHLLPERLALKVREFFARHIKGELAFPIHHPAILDTLYEAGVAAVWTFPYAHRAGVAQGMNRSCAQIVEELASHPVEIIGGATIHPADVDPVGILDEAFGRLGLRVLKLHCSVGDFSPDDPALDPVWDYVSARRIPVIVHAGHAVSGHTNASELQPLERTAQKFPEARIIIAHCAHYAGGTALGLVEKYPALYADLTPVVTETAALPPEIVKKVAHKLLFGSDAPNVALSIGQCLAHIKSFGLSEEAEAAVMGENARRLIDEVKIFPAS